MLTHLTAEELTEAAEIPEVKKAAKKLEREMTLQAMQARLTEMKMWTCIKGSIYARKQMVALRLATIEYLLSE